MRFPLQRALDLAAERAREAEATYKGWARAATLDEDRALFAELGAAERGHWQLLAHITPGDLPAPLCGAAGFRVEGEKKVEPLPPLPSSKGLSLAAEREAFCAAIYDRLAAVGGETATLFRSLAEEERSHKKRMEAILKRAASGGM